MNPSVILKENVHFLITLLLYYSTTPLLYYYTTLLLLALPLNLCLCYPSHQGNQVERKDTAESTYFESVCGTLHITHTIILLSPLYKIYIFVYCIFLYFYIFIFLYFYIFIFLYFPFFISYFLFLFLIFYFLLYYYTNRLLL